MGSQPGHLADGLLYLSVRPDRVQAFLQSLPIPPPLAADLARARELLGLDPSLDDVVGELGLAPQAIVSATFGRPLDVGALQLRLAFARSDIPADEPRRGASPGPEQPRPANVAPPEDSLRAAATGLAMHARIHIPVVDPTPLLDALSTAGSPARQQRWRPLCRTIETARLCFGTPEAVLIVRTQPEAVLLDVLVRSPSETPPSPSFIDTAGRAVAALPEPRAEVAALSGDAAALLDPQVLPALAQVDGLMGAWSSLRASRAEGRPPALERDLQSIAALEMLSATPSGLQDLAIEMSLEADRVRARARWRRDPNGDLVRPSTSIQTDAPSLDSLCQGSSACVRTGPWPDPATWRDTFATGAFARPRRALLQSIHRARPWSTVLLIAAAWPSLAGASVRWPGEALGGGPGTGFATGLVEALGSVRAAGASLREVESTSTGRSPQMVAFVRAPRQPIDQLAGLSAYAGRAPSVVSLPGTLELVSRIELGPTVGGSVYLSIDDPSTPDDQAPRYGFAAIASTPAAMAGLLELPRDRRPSDPLYLKLSAPWRVVSRLPELAARLRFARAWLAERTFEATLTLPEAGPTIDLVVRRPATATGSP